MSSPAIDATRKESLWYLGLVGLFAFSFLLRWPYPGPGWIHIDERVFLLNPLKLWSGDLNPHFFIYPTLHIYLTSILYYLYYLLCGNGPIEQFIALQFFVDGSELIAVGRHFNALLSAVTAGVVALIGRRLYGLRVGLIAGLFFAVLPLSVRFAHLATTDGPAALWSACALFFAVRIAQGGSGGDWIWAGVCVGLAGGTKYPAALASVPVAAAALLRDPTLRQRGLWIAGAAAVLVFVIVSPYVVIDAESAWADLALMGKVHLASEDAKAEIATWRYYLQYALRYGFGAVGLVALGFGLLWRPLARRPGEWVVVVSFAVFFSLLLAAESAFMRYALPLAAPACLLWARLLVARGRVVASLFALALLAEPLYASWQTRALLAGDDTREQVERLLAEDAPDGGWLIQLPPFIGNVDVFQPDKVYSHERRFRLSYSRRDLIEAYRKLSQYRDLPPLYFGLNPGAAPLRAAGGSAEGRAYVLHYRHPAIPTAMDEVAADLLAQCHWLGEYAAGGDEAVYEAVDWFFAPIGGFGGVERTGPNIRVGRVPLATAGAGLAGQRFFSVLHGILEGERLVAAGEWQEGMDLYRTIWQSPVPLDKFLSADYLYTYFFNYGIAADKLGRLQEATHMWQQASELKDDRPVLHQNLGVAYARQGQVALAREHLRRALALDADYAEAHFNLGNLLYQEGKTDSASAAYNRAVAADSGLVGAWQGLGNVHFNKGEWSAALAAYRRALALAPGAPGVAFNLAKVHLQIAAPDSAIAALRSALEVEPRDVEALYLLGDLLRRQGLGREARSYYGRALELAPGDQRADALRNYLERDL